MSVHPRALDYTESMLARAIPDESELTAGTRITPGERYGFFTDTTLCIGCKACEVACKQWNNLPADGLELSGASYDNTLALGATTWRHVAFVEQFPSYPGLVPSLTAPGSWLLMSDVCKHCQRAGC